MNKLSGDPLMLGFTYLAYNYKLSADELIKFWAYILNYLLSYLSLSCSFVSVPYFYNPGLLHNLDALIRCSI